MAASNTGLISFGVAECVNLSRSKYRNGDGLDITHLLPQTATVFLRDSFGHRHGGHTAGLGAADLAPGGVARLGQILGDLGGLAGARLPDHNQDLVVVDGLEKTTTR